MQIAEALEAAHEKGVIQRDLKPDNIKVTPDGKVKVLDFGLAKAFEGDAAEATVSNSPTLSMAATQQGVILGTAAYMSPEQAKGRTVDKRTDVWAFGCVLYEMLTGRQSFGASDATESLAAVISLEPKWDTLPTNLHPRLREVVERCLEKSVTKRFQDIGDVKVDIEKVLVDPSGVIVQPVADVVHAAPQSKLLWVAVTFLAVAVAVVATRMVLMPVEPGSVTRSSYTLPEGQAFTNLANRSILTISPDGSRIVYAANRQLHMRLMNSLESTPIPGIDENPHYPFFSPNGQWIGYWSDDDTQLKKIAVSGGAPVTLANTNGNPFGTPTWGADDMIVWAEMGRVINTVSANGGTPEVLIASSPEMGNLGSPEILPGGEWVLYREGNTQQGQILVESLVSGDRQVLFSGVRPRYLSTGHIVYGLDGVLLAVPFDLGNLEVTGGPVPLVEGIRPAPMQYAVSDSGSLAYIPGAGATTERELVWVERDGGAEETIPAQPRAYEYPRISHDGSRVAVDEVNQDGDIWVWNFGSENSFRLTTAEGGEGYPVWTAADARIAFGSVTDTSIDWKASNNTGSVELLTAAVGSGTQGPNPYSFASEDRLLVFREQNHPETLDNIGMIAFEDGAETEWLLASEFIERNADLSPDGQWMAYESDESGQFEIYVRPFPMVNDNLWPISTAGGSRPLWGRDGEELFYLEPGTPPRLMAVPVDIDSPFEHQTPQLLLEWPYFSGANGRSYDISPDDGRFLAVRPVENSGDVSLPQIIIVLNWFEELKERVPVP